MADRFWFLFFAAFSCLFSVLNASAGDSDPVYRACVGQCEKTGCVADKCFQQCRFLSSGVPVGGSWYMHEPLYWQLMQWVCQSDCRYYCMVNREKEREMSGQRPVKYHGKWPFKRVFGFQEPASVVFSALNLAVQLHGWVSLFKLLYCKLPLRQSKKTYYEYTGLWHIYGLVSVNAWFWSAVFHSRDVDLTEKLDYFSAVALLGYTLILAILRTFSVRDEAGRVMVAAPLIAFVTTHILYLNFYKFDYVCHLQELFHIFGIMLVVPIPYLLGCCKYFRAENQTTYEAYSFYGLNMKVCIVMGVAQLLLWLIWAGITRHPSRLKLWVVVGGGGLALLLEIYDFPPYWGCLDAHALWHAVTILLGYLWWSFIRDDAEYRTMKLVKKAK